MCNEDFYMHLSLQMAQTVNISNTIWRCSDFPVVHSGLPLPKAFTKGQSKTSLQGRVSLWFSYLERVAFCAADSAPSSPLLPTFTLALMQKH